MHVPGATMCALILFFLTGTLATSSWSFSDASVVIQRRGSGSASSQKKLTPSSPISEPLTLGSKDILKLSLTTVDDKQPKRPHQAFLTLREPSTGLEDSYQINVKESGRSNIELTHKDIPLQFLQSSTTASKPLAASLVIASFGSSQPLKAPAFSLSITLADASTPLPASEPPPRHSALPEIHHIFKPDPTSPHIPITVFFGAAVFVTLPVLAGAWMSLGGNVNHVGEAFKKAPFAHAGFLGGIVAMEIIFAAYYVGWGLFKALPATAIAGSIVFVSGSRALGEVQSRRLAGKR
ncbi:MAG: hypothetical protein M1831_002689 [Alyxoria varia]|nr:MAG: hypothetical protein M1831_002689 [Alyxoria varia]